MSEPSKPTVDEVRELLKHVERVHPGHSTDVIVVDRNIVAKLCRHFLASQQPMTAGEFAGLVVADIEKREAFWRDGAKHLEQGGSVAAEGRERMLLIAGIFAESKSATTKIASEHNITIVEPPKP